MGEAYVLNGEYEKAINILSELHNNYSDNINVQYTLLDALFAAGKSEDDFKWIEKPSVMRLDKETLNLCYDFLKLKRKPRTLSDLYTDFLLSIGFYLKFDENDLFQALLQDNRFEVVTNKGHKYDSVIKVVRSKCIG